jgi:hypothetical protein
MIMYNPSEHLRIRAYGQRGLKDRSLSCKREAGRRRSRRCLSIGDGSTTPVGSAFSHRPGKRDVRSGSERDDLESLSGSHSREQERNVVVVIDPM